MRKASRDKAKALILCVCSVLFALGFTAVAVMCVISAKYVIMLIPALFSAISAYAATYHYFKFIDARDATELLAFMDYSESERRRMNISEISAIMGWREDSTIKFMDRCRKRGYF